MQQATSTIGGALRQVREQRGLSLDEASRDTRIRRDFLEALEGDDFDRLLGDVHVRGCLRTYASYLRLSPDKVVQAYASTLPEGSEAAPIVAPIQHEPVLGVRRRRDNHLLLILVATATLVLAAAFGVLSSRQPAPAPADMPTQATSVAASTLSRGITVAVLARSPVEVTVTADDGTPEPYTLEVGEGRSFDAEQAITIRLSDGGSAKITVSGIDKGFPGRPGSPWQHTYRLGSAPSP